MAELQIALYVSSVEGHHVTRYGTGTLIGATVDLEHPGNLRWDTEKIVAIPEAEYLAFKREYDVLLEDDALKKRTAEEYAAYQAAIHAAIESAAKPKDPAPEPTKPETPHFPTPAPEAPSIEPAHEAEEHV